MERFGEQSYIALGACRVEHVLDGSYSDNDSRDMLEAFAGKQCVVDWLPPLRVPAGNWNHRDYSSFLCKKTPL